MNERLLPSLEIGPYRASIPIVQGGMGVGVSLSGLAAAVANEGGVGVIASVGIGGHEPDFDSNYAKANKRALKREVRKAKQRSEGIIAVNVMAALSDFREHLEGAVEARADLVFLGAGLPTSLPDSLPLDSLSRLHTKFVPIVSSGKAANLILRAWWKRYRYAPPAVVVEGPKAGGHLGFSHEQIDDPDYRLEKLLGDVLDTVRPFEACSGSKISVLAAGGVYTGADIDRMLRLGADGVQMATRFVTTYECDVHQAYKDAYLAASEEDLVLIESPLGLPGRAIRGEFLSEASAGLHRPRRCTWNCLRPCHREEALYCIGQALLNSRVGRMDAGFAFAGANAHRAERMCSVREVCLAIEEEYAATCAGALAAH